MTTCMYNHFEFKIIIKKKKTKLWLDYYTNFGFKIMNKKKKT